MVGNKRNFCTTYSFFPRHRLTIIVGQKFGSKKGLHFTGKGVQPLGI